MLLHIIHTAINTTTDVTSPSSVSQTITSLGAWSAQQDAPAFSAVRLPFHKLNWIKLLPFHKLTWIKLLPFRKLTWIKLSPFHKLNWIKLKGLKAFNYSLDPGSTPIFELVV